MKSLKPRHYTDSIYLYLIIKINSLIISNNVTNAVNFLLDITSKYCRKQQQFVQHNAILYKYYVISRKHNVYLNLSDQNYLIIFIFRIFIPDLKRTVSICI